MHVRLHYIKFDKTLKQRFVEKENNHINLSISRSTFSITFKSMTASAKSSYLFIFMTKAQVARSIEFSIDFSITLMNLIASVVSTASIISIKSFYSMKSSIVFESTSAILKFSYHLIIIMNASIVCSFTFSSTSSRSSIASYQKSYFIMNDLFEIFAEKSSKRNMNIIQKKSIFSCSSESRQIRIKLLRQRNSKNTIMFAEKQFKKNLNAIRKKMRSSFFSMFDQIQIINYFKFID